MDKTVVVSIITGSVAFLTAVFAAVFSYISQRRVKRLEDKLQAERTARKFREPLAHAAYDLQSRIFNIVEIGFLNLYLDKGSERTRFYAVKNTLFLVAQYFAWTELVRHEIQFIDLGEDEETRRLARLRDSTYAIWQSNEYHPLFRIFAGEQRAIGERLIREGPRGPECMGYASFLDFYHEHPDPLLAALEEEIRSLSGSLEQVRPRLVKLQHSLIDLLAFLDPGEIRFPRETRTKLEVS
jgi:hypothetical protein